MPGPPDLRLTRRAQRRAQLRRRRWGLGALLVVAAVLAVAVIQALGTSSTSSPRQAATGAGGAGARTPPGSGAARTRTAARTATGEREVRRLARLGLPLYCAGGHGNEVAFTFDDGPGPYTHYALKKLRQAHERATFFVVGRSIDSFPGWLQRELPFGVIADHSLTHPLLTSLPVGEVQTQIDQTRQKIESQTGQRVTLFRPPYGGRNASVDAVARRLGLLEVLWNIDSADSLGANWAGIIHNVEAGLHPGSIILMHENRGQTIRALTTLLPELHRRHLRSVTLPELLASDPPSPAQLRAGPNGCGGTVLHGSGG